MEVRLHHGEVVLDADVELRANAAGIVLFAHGSGSGRRSPRNEMVAEQLQVAGFGTVLFDLLTPDEQVIDARDGSLRFNIGLLGERLTAAVDELAASETCAPPIGLFGASTGAAAALVAAASRPELIASIVSRGGRPDLASRMLAHVRAATLLIVGSRDRHVLELNHAAAVQINAECQISVVPNAGHLFEEPGTLEEVASQAVAWFHRTLSARRTG